MRNSPVARPRRTAATCIALLVAAVGAFADTDPVLLGTNIDLTYEYRLRSATVLVEEAPIKSGMDLSRNVLDPPPFAAFDWELGRKSGLAIGFAAELRKQFAPDEGIGGGDYAALFSPDNFLTLGGSGNPLAFENPMITKGALYWRSETLDITFGRDKVDLGEGLKGSLYPSPRLPYLDAFNATGTLGRLKMNWLVATIRANGAWDGMDVKPNEGLDPEDYPSPIVSDPLDELWLKPYGFQGDPNPTTIIEALHRFSWDFGKFQLGAAGHVMYSRRNNRFLITDFLPVISWHQTTVMSNNMSLLLDASWEPNDSLRIMGMAGLDEMNASDVGVSDSGSPTVPAAVLGASYNGRLGQGALEAYAELGYTHWLWGNYDGSNDAPGDANPLGRAQYRLYMDSGDGLLPLTSPYGPGAIWGELSGGWTSENTGLRLGLELLVLSKVKAANLITTDPLAPLSDPSRFLFVEAAFPVRWKLGDFELYTVPAILARDGTWWVEARLGAAYHLRRSTEIGAAR